MLSSMLANMQASTTYASNKSKVANKHLTDILRELDDDIDIINYQSLSKEMRNTAALLPEFDP
jgi:hypothetical protein